MEEEGEPAIVRHAQFERNPYTPNEKQSGTKLVATARKFLDAKCPLCQSYGHPQHQCDRMALWFHLREASKSVDEKLKAQITKNYYAKVDEERRATKLARFKGTVQQLYNDGQIITGEQLLAEYMEKLDNSNHQVVPLLTDEYQLSSADC